MKKKEIAEIKKQFNITDCNITRIDTALIVRGESVARKQQTFLSMEDEDIFKYLDIFKKTLSGKLGKNLLNLKFRQPDPETSWGFLEQIRNSGLKDSDLIECATTAISEKLDNEKNWFVIWASGVYDVPRRTKDGAELEDSEDLYDYVLCNICPLKIAKAALGYDEETMQVKSREQDWTVERAEYGFLYPAFDNRMENRDALLYYTRKPDEPNEDLIKILGLEETIIPEIQKETFWCGAKKALGKKWGFNVVMGIFDGINQAAEEKLYNNEDIKLTPQDIKAILEDAGTEELNLDPTGKSPEIENITDLKKIEIMAGTTVVRVDPENSGSVKIQEADGEKIITIKTTNEIWVNGVSCKKE